MVSINFNWKIQSFWYIICLFMCSEQKGHHFFYWWQYITKPSAGPSVEIGFVKFLHWVNVQRTYSRGLCCWLAEGLNVRVLEGRGSKTAPKRFLTQSGQVDWYCLTVHTASQTIVNCKLKWYAIFAISKMVFCYQNCSDLLWEKIVLVIEKNFWNSRLKAENFQKFWDH